MCSHCHLAYLVCADTLWDSRYIISTSTLCLLIRWDRYILSADTSCPGTSCPDMFVPLRFVPKHLSRYVFPDTFCPDTSVPIRFVYPDTFFSMYLCFLTSPPTPAPRHADMFCFEVIYEIITWWNSPLPPSKTQIRILYMFRTRDAGFILKSS